MLASSPFNVDIATSRMLATIAIYKTTGKDGRQIDSSGKCHALCKSQVRDHSDSRACQVPPPSGSGEGHAAS